MKRTIAILGVVLALTGCRFNVNSDGVRFAGGKTVRCGGPVEVRDMDLTGFNAITVNGRADIDFTQSDVFGVTVSANEEAFDHLDFHVDGSQLILENKEHVNIICEELSVKISAPVIESITINGAADLDLEGGYHSDKDFMVLVNGAGDLFLSSVSVPTLSLQVNGAADLETRSIDVSALEVEVNGAGDVKASGKAGKASFSISGAGAVDARGLQADEWIESKSGIARIRH